MQDEREKIGVDIDIARQRLVSQRIDGEGCQVPEPESVARATLASVAGRLGKVEDIVPLIEFLASPASQWITAQTLFINGGYLAR
ncbi:hypothetical protein KSD_44930 [Ktedonobacter sp. SOSP1-85]|uniref:SDR family oxidoreductase n=1 Tax=Ktedonobacter sp. SOSP1-85 TaxID=2778367 RepID=UPI0019156DC9|nr:SDR family oxidoreductase [Ktedonobacter sp. SOSP1-85]GHO76722.1 hypothetical protein KSD_44930 [Ktedonobacter sp. SOSP1-85]